MMIEVGEKKAIKQVELMTLLRSLKRTWPKAAISVETLITAN